MQCIIMEKYSIKLTQYDETKKRAHDSQIVRAKENLKLSHGGSSYDDFTLLNRKLLNKYLGKHEETDEMPHNAASSGSVLFNGLEIDLQRKKFNTF